MMKNLKELFNKYNISLSEDQLLQFDKYFSMLIETNKVLNLTAITEENCSGELSRKKGIK